VHGDCSEYNIETGTRQAYLPGGHRTGAPGKHVIGGKAKYRLLDEKVRVYVAPPLEEIQSSPLKPYVSIGVRLSRAEERAVFGKFPGPRGLTPEHFLKVAREHTQNTNRSTPVEKKPFLPWPSVKHTSSTDASATDTSAVNTSAKDASVMDASDAKHSVHGEVARS